MSHDVHIQDLKSKIADLEKRVKVLEKNSPVQVSVGHANTVSVVHKSEKNFFQKWSWKAFASSFVFFLFGIYSALDSDVLGIDYEVWFVLGHIGFWGGLVGMIVGAVMGKKSQNIRESSSAPTHTQPEGMVRKTSASPDTDLETRKKESENEEEKMERESFEVRFGGNWLAKIGVALIVVGVVFFLRWSFENGLIGPTGRVFLSALTGIGLVIFGVQYLERFEKYALTAMGGGVATLYFTVFFAHNFYELIEAVPAFGMFVLLTVFTVFLSVFKDRQVMAWIGLLGGFLSPFLVDTPEPNLVQLYSYVLMLDVGILVIASRKDWAGLNIGALVLSFLLVGGTFVGADMMTGGVFLSVFFLLFLSLSVIHYLVQRKPSSPVSLSIALFAPLAYFGEFLAFLDYHHLDGYNGIFALILAILYVGVGAAVYLQIRDDRAIVETFFGMAITFIAVAIFLEASGVWVTVLWFLQSMVLILLAVRNRFSKLFVLGNILLVIALRRYLGDDFVQSIGDFTVLANTRFVLGVLISLSLGGLAWSIFSEKKYESYFTSARVYAVLAIVLPLIFGSAEIFDFWREQRMNLPSSYEYEAYKSIRMKSALSFSFYVFFYALMLFWTGIKRNVALLRKASLALFAFATLKVFVYDLSELEEGYRIASFIVLGIILLGVALWYQKNRKMLSEFLDAKKQTK